MSPFKELVQLARRTDWESAARQLYGPGEAYRWTVDDHCAAAALTALPALQGRVLDTACGRGTHAFALSGLCRAVYATDPDPDAVRFLGIRARQSGVSNILPFFGPPEGAIRPNSLDLVLARELPERGRLTALIRLLKPGGRLCLGLPNPRSPLCKSSADTGAAYGALVSALRRTELHVDRVYTALPDYRDVRVLLDADDPRGLVLFLKDRYRRIPLPGFLSGTLRRAFRSLAAPGYWAIVQKRPPSVTVIERTVREALEDRLSPAQPIRFPLIFANRGTFTLPVFTATDPTPVAVFRMDAARSLVHHEAKALRLVADRGEPELARSIPQILWEGRVGARHAALQTAMPGRLLPFPRTARDLEAQANALADWLAALYRIPVAPDELPHPRPAQQRALYRDEARLRAHIASGELADRFWDALKQLRAAGLRPALIHGDLHPENILKQRNDLAVLDWEYATVSWPPFDWLHYICSVILDGKKKGTATPETARDLLQRAFSLRDARSGVIQRASHRLLRNLELNPELYPHYCTLGLFDFIRRRFEIQSLPSFLPLFRQIERKNG